MRWDDRPRSGPSRLATLAVVVAAAPLALGAERPVEADWPQFRGPNRDGVSEVRGLSREWPAGGPAVVWKRPIGEGFSGISAAAGRLFTSFADGEREILAAIDGANGKELWRVDIGQRFDDEFGNGPRSTPTVDAETVYAISSKGQLFAVAAADGKTVWSVDVTESLGGKVPRWGYSSAPLVDKDLLLIKVGGGEGRDVYALDRKTGKPRWSALDGEAGYSSPIAVTLHGQRQYVFVASQAIVALRPDGQVHWTHEWAAGGIAMPVFVAPDRIFVSAAGDEGSVMLEVGQPEDGTPTVRELWRSRAMKNTFNSSVLHGERICGFDNATLRCIAVSDGSTVWAKRGLGKGSLISADGLLIVLGDQGQLVLADAAASGYEERGRFEVWQAKSWTAPTLAGTKLFLRSASELVCIDLAG